MKYAIQNQFNQTTGHLKQELSHEKKHPGRGTIKFFITAQNSSQIFNDLKQWLQQNGYALKNILNSETLGRHFNNHRGHKTKEGNK